MAKNENIIVGLENNNIKDFNITIISPNTLFFRDAKLTIVCTYGMEAELTGPAFRSGYYPMNFLTVKNFEGFPFNGDVVALLSQDNQVDMLVKSVFGTYEKGGNDKGVVTYGAVAEKYSAQDGCEAVFQQKKDGGYTVHVLVKANMEDSKLISAIAKGDKQKVHELTKIALDRIKRVRSTSPGKTIARNTLKLH